MWRPGPTVLRDFNPGRDGTGYQDFSGRDYPNIFIPGLMGSRNFLGWDQPKVFIPGLFEFCSLSKAKKNCEIIVLFDIIHPKKSRDIIFQNLGIGI